MLIIILGSTQVGATLAEELSREGHDIAVVDEDADRLQDLQQRLDIATVYGHASYPDILKRAGADTADMIIAVTDNDETNMVACQVAYSLFNIPTKIARIRSAHFFIRNELFGDANLPIDVFINPERLVTMAVSQLITYPGSLQVLDFANGNILLMAVKVAEQAPLAGKSIDQAQRELFSTPMHITLVYRKDACLPLTSDTVIQPGDEVYFSAAYEHAAIVQQAFCGEQPANKRLIIAGGGHIGNCLTQELASRYRVKLIEHNRARCNYLADIHSNVTILHGDATDRDLVVNENIEKTDVFCAVTNDDEANIIASLQAKHLGVRRVITLINKSSYMEILHEGVINITISPQLITIGSILTHIRSSRITQVYNLRRGYAEAIEAQVRSKEQGSALVGRSLSELKLPTNTYISAIYRDGEVLVAQPHILLEEGDKIVAILLDKSQVKAFEKLL